jgi:hypothetical protein
MAAESTNTIINNAFVDNNDGTYSLRTSGAGSGIDESGFGAGTVTAPVAGATIATHQPPASASGYLHKVVVTTWLSGTGTPAAADNFNMAFKYGDTNISDIPVAGDLNIPISTEFHFNAAEGVAFSVVAVGAATTAVDYNAMIVATRIEGS